MSISYSEFMPRIMEYAVDSAAEAPLILRGKEVGRLTPAVFVDKLYINWPDEDFEENVYQRLLTSTQLTCLAAFRGCGKTSALCHALTRLTREHPTGIAAVMLDIKQLYNTGVFAPLTDAPTEEVLGRAYQIFKTEIRRVVQLRLLPTPANTLKILAWVLAGPPDATDSFNDLLVASFIDLSDRIVIASRAGKKTRRERRTAIEHFLDTDAGALKYHEEAIGNVTTAHVVRAGMAIRGWRRVALIFDNIDRIPMPYQLKFMEAVNDTHNALGGACSTVVAVRRETLRYQVPRANEQGDPIDIIAPTSASYSPILFPDTKPEHVRRIFQARHDYSIDLFRANAGDSDAVIQRLIALHDSVVDEFVRDSIHALANGSIRALAKIYTGFFSYVHRAEAASITRGQDPRTEEGHLQTLFFLFLRENARTYGLIYYEIIKRDVDVAGASDVPDLASPHHLLLTALMNLCNEPGETSGGEQHATFRQLVDRIGSLGFSLDTIRSALGEMHAGPGEPPRTLEFLDVEPDIATLEGTASVRIRLTPLGQVLVNSLLHKVGYVWGQAYDSYVRVPGRRHASKTYYELDAHDRIRIFFSYVRSLAASHLKLLALVRGRLQKRYGRAWLAVYRQQFGVGEQFQVQRLCASAAAFYQPYFGRSQTNPFIALRRVYNTLLADIVHGASYGTLDLARLEKRLEDYAGGDWQRAERKTQ